MPTYCARLCAWAESTWWVVLIGVVNKMKYLRRSRALPNDSKHNEARPSTISTDMLYLRVAQMPRSPDLAIFVLMTTTDETDYFTPCACAWGKNCWVDTFYYDKDDTEGSFIHCFFMYSAWGPPNRVLFFFTVCTGTRDVWDLTKDTIKKCTKSKKLLHSIQTTAWLTRQCSRREMLLVKAAVYVH